MRIASEKDLQAYRQLCDVLRAIRATLELSLVPGVSPVQIDQIAAELLEAHELRSAFLDVRGFPARITASVGNVITNGIPTTEPLREGQLLRLQLGVHDGEFYSYFANTYPIGSIAAGARLLLQNARHALNRAVERCTSGSHVSTISKAIQRTVEDQGHFVVREMCGHGIGRTMHERPAVYAYCNPKAPDCQLGSGELISVQIMTLQRRVRTSFKGWELLAHEGPVEIAHVGAIVVCCERPEVLLGPEAFTGPGAIRLQ